MGYCGCPCIFTTPYSLYFCPYCQKCIFTFFLPSHRLIYQLIWILVYKYIVVVCMCMYISKTLLAIFLPILPKRHFFFQMVTLHRQRYLDNIIRTSRQSSVWWSGVSWTKGHHGTAPSIYFLNNDYEGLELKFLIYFF